MEKHHGQIIERVIRRSGHSISKLAAAANVNRRSFYNWFNQQRLKPEIISRIGSALQHDFSNEFPYLSHRNITRQDLSPAASFNTLGIKDIESPAQVYWKNKYISLLEKYNEMLLFTYENDNLIQHE